MKFVSHCLKVVSFFFTFVSLIAASVARSCPDLTAGETQEDCPWGGIARELIAMSEPGKSLRPAIEKRAPSIAAQLTKDGENLELRALWGTSINYDELAKGGIVAPEILRGLAEIFGEPFAVSEDARLAHAGMEHTYGYLFSILKTPFGYKRARWVRSDIEDGFGLPRGTLGPSPAKGTLLLNVTVFAGSIAFRSESNELAVVKKLASGAPKELRNFPYRSLKPLRLIESAEVPNAHGKVRRVTLYTDLVPFLHVTAPEANSHLLIYTVVDPFHHEAQLITAFPVQASFVDRVINPKELGKDRPIITRYNAFVDGLTGVGARGSRKVAPSAKKPAVE